MKKIFTKALKWLIPICGVAVAILGLITGQYSLAIWALLAAAFSWIAEEWRELSDHAIELSDHAIEYGDAMMLDNLKISSELCDAKLKIHDLQKEIKRLKKEE